MNEDVDEPSLTQYIFRAIKKHGKPIKAHALALLLPGHTYGEISRELDRLVIARLLSCNDGAYWPRYVLDAPMISLDAPLGTYEWEAIRLEAMGEKTPVKYSNPFLKFTPPGGFHQGGRGTCVGHSTALMMQCNYLAMTGDYPNEIDVKEAARNQVVQVGSCDLVYDKWYHSVFSPQWCYEISRQAGNISSPSGSTSLAAMKAMKSVGAVPWEKCLTSKTPACAPKCYPYTEADCRVFAEGHKIDGYATITSFDGVMDAIENSQAHCVIMPINLEQDYLTPDSAGNWKVHVGQPKAGSHSLCWVKTDREKGRIACKNSWGEGFPEYTWIDRRYWQENAGPGFVALDKTDAKIARGIYAYVTIVTNVPCIISVVDSERTYEQVGGRAALMLEAGFDYTIRATPKDPEQVNEPFIETTIEADRDCQIDLLFTLKTPATPLNNGKGAWGSLFERLRQLMVGIFGKPPAIVGTYRSIKND